MPPADAMLHFHPSPRRRAAAFTLAEMLVTVALSGVLGSIIYVVGTESLTSFARNVSINRSYSEARIAMDRIAGAVSSAGHLPVLINADGYTAAAVTTSAPRAAGIRFYQCVSPNPLPINGGTMLANTFTITLPLPTGDSLPIVGDLMTIPACGFEGQVTAVNGSTLTFGSLATLNAGCQTAPTLPLFSGTQYACLQFRQVAFVTVNNQLRYFPQAPTSANYTTIINDKTKYKVIANLVASPTDATQLLPFANGSGETTFPSPSPSPASTPTAVTSSPTTINVRICAEGPDYNNRKLGTANTFSQMQSSFGPRSPVLLRGTTNPF